MLEIRCWTLEIRHWKFGEHLSNLQTLTSNL